MAPVLATFPDELWEAAKDTDIPDDTDDTCWLGLKMFLKGRSVDLGMYTEAEWKEAFSMRRSIVTKELEKAKGKDAMRSSSAESERKLETGALDSAYHSDSPQEHSDQQILQFYALVKPSTDNPKGKAIMHGCFSDDTDEDFILQTMYDRLQTPKDKDGRVTVTYIPREGGPQITSRFAVREDDDGDADIVFARRRPAQKENLPQGQHHTDDHGPWDLGRSREFSGRLQQRIEGPTVEKTLAYLFLERPTYMQNLPDDEVKILGRKVGLAVRGAKTVNDT